MAKPKLYMIDEEQLERLTRVAKRLYTENRLNGDEMRDLGHTITAVTRTCLDVEIPSDWIIEKERKT